MANKSVFKSAPAGRKVEPATHTNRAGGKAYKLGEKAALAQYACTGTFNDTFYATGEDQIMEVLAILEKVDVEFIGKTAIYARQQGRMKDMPALLVAHLMNRGDEGREVVRKIFHSVIDNGRMLRNLFQIMRSARTGRKSLAHFPSKMMKAWFTSKTPETIFWQSVGNDPSLGDIIKMIHLADGGSLERKALHAYLLSKEYVTADLPAVVRDYLQFAEIKRKGVNEKAPFPKAPWEMLVGLPLSPAEWSVLAQQATWTQLRMNLNTFARHGVFKNDGITKTLAAKLADGELIRKAKPFPYQLMMGYLHTSETGEEAVPRAIRMALHKALDVATEIVPAIDGPAHVLTDVSGSMGSPVSGHRAGATTKATCVQVASMIACAFLKKNMESLILPYSDNLVLNHGIDPMDSVLTNADKLARLGGGGTNLGAAFTHLNKVKAKGDLVIVISDMETWMDSSSASSRPSWLGGGEGTVSASAWENYKSRNPKAKLVCINLAAGDHCQVANNTDVLNLGGFSDTLWEVIKSFVEGRPSADHWVKTIETIAFPAQA